MNVETYTIDKGSNMDCIEYSDDATLEDVVNDLHRYTDWDYAIVTLSDGRISIIER